MTTVPVTLTKTKLFSISLGLLVATVVGLHQHGNVLAQENIDTPNQVVLTAIPPRLGEDNSIKLKPGEKTQITVRVRNSSPTTSRVQTRARDFIIGEDGSTPVPVTEEVSNKWALSSWLTVTPNIQTLDPQETAGIAVLIEVPEDALPGGHYAMITHSLANEDTTGDNQENSNTAITQEVGTLLYVIVDGPINEQAFVRDFDFNNGKFAEFGPVPYAFTVENESDVHIRPLTKITITDIFGRTVATLQPETKNIFPLTNRSYEGSWDQVWGTGFYRAELTASYGETGNVITAKDTFWLLPIKLVIAVLIIILTLIAILVSIRRHMIHRQDDRNKKIAALEDRLKDIESEKLKKFDD